MTSSDEFDRILISSDNLKWGQICPLYDQLIEKFDFGINELPNKRKRNKFFEIEKESVWSFFSGEPMLCTERYYFLKTFFRNFCPVARQTDPKCVVCAFHIAHLLMP